MGKRRLWNIKTICSLIPGSLIDLRHHPTAMKDVPVSRKRSRSSTADEEAPAMWEQLLAACQNEARRQSLAPRPATATDPWGVERAGWGSADLPLLQDK
jgi:hypothetical protein